MIENNLSKEETDKMKSNEINLEKRFVSSKKRYVHFTSRIEKEKQKRLY